ncbi:Na(+)-translocating NADH-quinone reductase subunit A [Flavobacteriaceae bacterium]|nr:Na(+)-translocating NADH-quinone reductase subunit A [Flavobacteriaceae bacterium]
MDIIKGIRTQRGAKLNIKGSAEKILLKNISSPTYALNTDDFFGTIPKLLVKEGTVVNAGDPVFFSKQDPRIKIVSPVSGTIKEIERGPKRKIEKIIIEANQSKEVRSHVVSNWEGLNRNELISLLLESGNWPFLKQRPYGTLANPDEIPKAIFVSTIDTSPLAPDYDFILKNSHKNFQQGINVLNKLVNQNVFLGMDATHTVSFEKFDNVQFYTIQGPHPAGNLSFHIQELTPINMGDRVWTINPEDIVNLGRFVTEGVFSPQRCVALAGNGLKRARYFSTKIGVEIVSMIKEVKTTESSLRFINGDVLSGKTSSVNGYLGYYNNLISVIPEGNDNRMFGWLPFKDNHILSLSNTSFSKFFNKKGFSVDTSLNGEERAIVVTGEMEKVFPLDLYPMQLIKACMIEDIEKMEALGIYEVVPEDFGLIDYANTSKLEAQEIIKQGIELMINEVG